MVNMEFSLFTNLAGRVCSILPRHAYVRKPIFQENVVMVICEAPPLPNARNLQGGRGRSGIPRGPICHAVSVSVYTLT